MRIGHLTIIALLFLACQSNKDYRIEVPEETQITSETILTELETMAVGIEDDSRILKQQLYFCEQLGWPTRCEQMLLKAEAKWGQTERITDQMVAYYLRHEDYERVENLLKGKFETRKRMEARLKISIGKNDPDLPLLARYLAQNGDISAKLMGLQCYQAVGDTVQISKMFAEIESINNQHQSLRQYIPFLENNQDYQRAIYVTQGQLERHDSDSALNLKLAQLYYKSEQLDTAKYLLHTLGTITAREQLYKWYMQEQSWDSAITQLNYLIEFVPESKDLIYAKATALESRGWVTGSLPYYELALSLDTTDIELAKQVDLVRRKVAYLRRKKELEESMPPPVIRKTAN